MLSTIYPLATESIKNRIKYSMPYSVKSVTKPVFSNIKVELLKVNFIIHETVQLPGLPWNQVESMNFKVSFLDRGALPMETWNNVWISGGVMNTIISPTMKKMKFIYDETIIMKDGWRSRGVPLKTPYNEDKN